MESIATVEPFTVDDSSVVKAAINTAIDLAEATFEDVDVEYNAVGRVVDEDGFADGILTTAEERDCDHVFISGRRRSPTGKAIFGDTAQAVALNFDGPVTLITT